MSEFIGLSSSTTTEGTEEPVDKKHTASSSLSPLSSSSSSSSLTSVAETARLLLSEPIETIRERTSKWHDDLPHHVARATYKEEMYRYSHDRFFPFEPIATCKNMVEIGRANHTTHGNYDDDSKFICGLESPVFQQEGCIIYSIGSNNQFGFEEALLNQTKCDIHTFDCTGPITRFNQKPKNPRSHFHHICLSHEYVPAPPSCQKPRDICGEMMTLSQLQAKLNHTSLALLKMDVEGYEIPMFKSWWVGNETAKMPAQIVVEIHYATYRNFAAKIKHNYMNVYNPDQSPDKRSMIQNAPELLLLNQILLEMGYVVVSKDDNPLCYHCTEVVLIRIPPKDILKKKLYQYDER